MGNIDIMDDRLSNKIAAGEVVERPASIVKELVENALDAGSKHIEVYVEEAGLRLIRIVDDGAGMDREDATKAFERHATSKVKNEYDLFRIETLGFRGEALASIAAVSKVQMTTSTGQVGTYVEIHGGQFQQVDGAPARKGTDFQVSQLFYNTPARLKHMKSLQTELGHCIDLVNRLAFSHPEVSFKLVSDGKPIVETTGRNDQLRNIASIYGIQIAQKMVAFQAENQDYRIKGYVSLPEVTLANRNYMTFLINRRWVKSYAIQQAVLDSMHTFLPIGRFPIVVLEITTDPQLTDVNVHPSKQQVRLGKEASLLQLIRDTIRHAVQERVTIPVAVPPKPKHVESYQPTIWEKEAPPIVERPTVPPQTNWQEETPLPVVDCYREPEEEVLTIPSQEEEVTFPNLEVVGQVHGTYIIAQNEDGFYMIDQHAAQERIKYEFFKEQLGKATGEERHQLLIPLIFHYSKAEMEKIEERKSLLEQAGVFLEPFGPSSYTVREYPTWFPEEEVEETIEQLIEQLLTHQKIDITALREEAAIMMSCKRSIKANHYLTKEHMEQLLYDLSKAEHPYTCPHGRPVLIHFTTTEIEKMFKRIM